MKDEYFSYQPVDAVVKKLLAGEYDSSQKFSAVQLIVEKDYRFSSEDLMQLRRIRNMFGETILQDMAVDGYAFTLPELIR